MFINYGRYEYFYSLHCGEYIKIGHTKDIFQRVEYLSRFHPINMKHSFYVRGINLRMFEQMLLYELRDSKMVLQKQVEGHSECFSRSCHDRVMLILRDAIALFPNVFDKFIHMGIYTQEAYRCISSASVSKPEPNQVKNDFSHGSVTKDSRPLYTCRNKSLIARSLNSEPLSFEGSSWHPPMVVPNPDLPPECDGVW